MKILVTGSSGYIGKSFIKYYKKKYTFSSFSLQYESLESIDFEKISTVLHCAALVHQSIDHSYDRYYEINVTYPFELAKLAKKNGVKQFVFLSTIGVYGDSVEKIDENSTPNPVSFYGQTKLEAEKKLISLGDESFVVSIVRPPMVYGKDAPGNIDRLIKTIKKVPFLPLKGIENRRSFVYIGNLCHLIEVIIDKNVSGVYLAGDDEPLSTTELIESIAEGLDKKIYLFKVPFFPQLLKLIKPSFFQRLYGSLELNTQNTNERLAFTNKYSTKEGIKLMIKGEER